MKDLKTIESRVRAILSNHQEAREGNSGDSVRINQYSVGHYEILGYGVPQY